MSVRDPHETQLLYAINRLASRLDDPGEALDRILDILLENFSGCSGSIALINPDSGQLEVEIHRGLPEDGGSLALRPGQGITGWVAFHGRPLLVPDVSADPRYIGIRPSVRCEMAVPMQGRDGQVVGVINLDSESVNGFGPADLDRLVRCTSEATAVVERLWLVRHLKGKASQLESLISIGQSLVTKLEQQELLDAIAREAGRFFRRQLCWIYLVDSEDQSVRIASWSGPEGASPPPAARWPLASSLAGSAVHTRKQVEFHHIGAPDYIDLEDVPRELDPRSVLTIPIPIEADVAGVIAVFSDRPHRFSDEEKRLFTALANLASVAMQNVRLYARVFEGEEILRKNETLTTLGLLAAEIAHEIRNPLTVIKLLYGGLGLEYPVGDPRHRDLQVIGEKLDQLEAIVGRVLDFARTPAGLYSRWPVHEIIEETLHLVRLKFHQSHIEVDYDSPEQQLLVDGNKGQLQQVVLNLLINATEAMPGGGRIRLRAVPGLLGGRKAVQIDIADTGGGIPEGIGDRIFDSFLTGRSDGTGLGLSICKRILAAHHGDITVAASSPEGTVMRVLLPAV